MVSRSLRWMGALGAVLCFSAHAAPDARSILRDSDRARGGGMPGIVWDVRLTGREGARRQEDMRFEVHAVADASLVETIEPERSQGTKLLQIGRNMWLGNRNLAKPIPISPRQRMSGLASNGDIAATNYARDYDAAIVSKDALDGESCYVLDLRAHTKHATYDRIRYWISVPRRLGVKAEFYSVSGRLIKAARFDYGNTIEFEGRRIPFVSRMRITDALTDRETTLVYEDARPQTIPASEFDLGQDR